MRELCVIDGELRLVTRAWCAARELSGHTPSTELIDQLLDERLRWQMTGATWLDQARSSNSR